MEIWLGAWVVQSVVVGVNDDSRGVVHMWCIDVIHLVCVRKWYMLFVTVCWACSTIASMGVGSSNNGASIWLER